MIGRLQTDHFDMSGRLWYAGYLYLTMSWVDFNRKFCIIIRNRNAKELL